MITPAEFVLTLRNAGLDFFVGVPDSLMKDFCCYLTDAVPQDKHVIAANEGGAVSIAIGHYLATGAPGVVYLQNSGVGNMVNPLLSLADPRVYGIPMLLVIGWRGQPGHKDEPQHVLQGELTADLLATMKIPIFYLDGPVTDARPVIGSARMKMMERSGVVAILVSEKTFEKYEYRNVPAEAYPLSREQAIEAVVSRVGSDCIVVSTTGMASRELFEYRAKRNEGHGRDFLTVGGMGHASQIALGIAMGAPDRTIFCLDGDGAALMHLGSFAIIGQSKQKNFRHILVNNGSHDSVGGQPTAAFGADLRVMALAAGYRYALTCSTAEELQTVLKELLVADGPSFLEIRVHRGARADLGRPTTSPVANRDELMATLRTQGGQGT